MRREGYVLPVRQAARDLRYLQSLAPLPEKGWGGVLMRVLLRDEERSDAIAEAVQAYADAWPRLGVQSRRAVRIFHKWESLGKIDASAALRGDES